MPKAEIENPSIRVYISDIRIYDTTLGSISAANKLALLLVANIFAIAICDLMADQKQGDLELLYFPLKQFSPRFGPTFFSFRISRFERRLLEDDSCLSCNNGSPVIYFEIDVYRGNKTWKVYRRFRQFAALVNLISYEDRKELISSLPPKTWCRVTDDNDFLNLRMAKLDAFTGLFLTTLSKNKRNLSGEKTVLEFLEIYL
jgi:hypothetical protein